MGLVLVSGAASARVEIATLPTADAERLLAQVIGAGVAVANCSDANVSESDGDRLTRVTDLLAARLGISTDTLDDKWYDEAFDSYDAGADAYCAKWVPQIQAILDEIPL
ncbi:MAG: hypothetical protein KF723_00150 [Rhizobiaceae bacterium]|nr:hypothetical protein [Rhizobiaceae bacterium]